jgi:hypothetical protein
MSYLSAKLSITDAICFAFCGFSNRFSEVDPFIVTLCFTIKTSFKFLSNSFEIIGGLFYLKHCFPSLLSIFFFGETIG